VPRNVAKVSATKSTVIEEERSLARDDGLHPVLALEERLAVEDERRRRRRRDQDEARNQGPIWESAKECTDVSTPERVTEKVRNMLSRNVSRDERDVPVFSIPRRCSIMTEWRIPCPRATA